MAGRFAPCQQLRTSRATPRRVMNVTVRASEGKIRDEVQGAPGTMSWASTDGAAHCAGAHALHVSEFMHAPRVVTSSQQR